MYRKNLFAKRILSILLSTLMLVSFAPVAGLADELEEIEVVDFENIAEPEEIPADESTDEPTNEPTDTPTDEPSAPAADEPVDEDESVTTAADAVEGEEPATEPVVVDVSYNSENVYDAYCPNFPDTMTVTVAETEGATYQWQSKSGESDWVDMADKTSKELAIDVTLDNLVKAYRCVVGDTAGEAIYVLSQKYIDAINDASNGITDLDALNAYIKADKAVARIGETYYMTLDEAVVAAADGATITLLADCTTNGFNLEKNLTIDGGSDEHTVTFNQYGIALWGRSLTFNNANVEMYGIGSTPYTAEWNWMTICASKNASLTLNNTTMTMDGSSAGNAHAIYFCSNNKLNLNGSTLKISNYPQDALEWDGGDGGYNVNITNSTYISDHNRSGFTGTFWATIKESTVEVINSTGNGSNGSHFVIDDSTVKFNNNGAHGLSTGNLTIKNESTVEGCNNGGNGVHVNGKLEISSGSRVTITDNDCSISSKWTIPGALYISGESMIKKATVTIKNNKGSGIYQKSGSLVIDSSATVTITNNEAVKLGYGGGIYANGTMNIGRITLYNNHAGNAGDDIYNTGTFSFGDVGTNWILDDCNHPIDAWYDDSEVSEDAIDGSGRYKVHLGADETEDDMHVVEFASGEYETAFAIKAAHNILKPTPITPKAYITINKFDGEGNPLTGASFTVTNADGSSSMGVNMSDVSTKTVGIYEEGTFVVTETVVPEGYTPSAPVTVTVTERDNGTRETAAVVNVYNTKAGDQPTAEPTAAPTGAPTTEPTAAPEPTAEPTAAPEPTAEPTAAPEPTEKPTARPTAAPTDDGGESDVPKTGDSFPVEAVSLVLASLVALACIVILMRRRIGRV